MAWDGTVHNFCWPLTDHEFGRDEMSAALACPGLWHSQCTTGAQTGRQLTLQCTASLDVERLIDGFVRDPHGGIIGEVERKPLTDLLWAPTLTLAAIRAATMPAADPRHLRTRFCLAAFV